MVLDCNFYSIYVKNKTILMASVILVTILFVMGSDHTAFAENKTVTIPLGAANPNFDTQAIEWFSPSVITVNAGDTVTWVNNDKEIHNITSGNGITRTEFVTTSRVGTPDGLFQSGSFSPGQSWSHTFTKPGIFHYFCSIHPWMNGVVVVSKQIPDTPTDSTGKPIIKWPVKAYTQDKQYEEDLTWEPHVILTGEKITFVFQFYGGGPTYYKLVPRLPYEFVITENGKELFRNSGMTQIGGGYQSYGFKEPGTATFKFDNIGGEGISTEFSSIVYQNPNQTNANIPVVPPARNIVLGQELVIILVAPSITIFLVVILSLKGVFSKKSVMKEERPEQKRTPI